MSGSVIKGSERVKLRPVMPRSRTVLQVSPTPPPAEAINILLLVEVYKTLDEVFDLLKKCPKEFFKKVFKSLDL